MEQSIKNLFFFSFKYFLVSDWLQFPGEKMALKVIQRRNGWLSDQNLTDEMQKYAY